MTLTDRAHDEASDLSSAVKCRDDQKFLCVLILRNIKKTKNVCEEF